MQNHDIIDDGILLGLYDSGKLAEKLKIPLNRNRILTNESTASSLLREVHISMLSRRDFNRKEIPKISNEYTLLKDRLFYLLLERTEKEAHSQKGHARICCDGEEYSYKINYTDSALCAYDSLGRVITLIKDFFQKDEDPFAIVPENDEQIIEVVNLFKKSHIKVLDAGIGKSKKFEKVGQRLKEIGKSSEIYGINLTDVGRELNLAVPCFQGIFEEFNFPYKFDLIYSDNGSSFYTPNPEKYVSKLIKILESKGVAFLHINHAPEWKFALDKFGVNYELLNNIEHTNDIKQARKTLEKLSLHTEEGYFRATHGSSLAEDRTITENFLSTLEKNLIHAVLIRNKN